MSLGTVSYYYLASADVTLPNRFGTPVQVNVRRVLEKQIISPWNYALFYIDRLEIQPGPQFNITGWVHTNERLYTGHNTLAFLSKVTYAEDWYVGFCSRRQPARWPKRRLRPSLHPQSATRARASASALRPR